MPVHRSFTIALVLAGALLASTATLAWAAGIVGGHRADHIGTFQPISHHLAPAATLRPGRAGAADRRPAIATTPATMAVTPTRDRTTTTTIGTTTTRDDNGRNNDD